MIVVEYVTKFIELADFILRLVEDEHDQVHKFEMKSRIETKKQVMLYKLTAYIDVVKKALKIEMKVNEEHAKREENKKK